MDKAGDVSIFRFTIRVPQTGDLVRTYFPNNVERNASADPAILDICQESLFLETNPISNCLYDAATNMVEFPLPDHITSDSFFTYELGYMRNPPQSQQLSGFDIQVLDSVDPDTILYSNTEVSVRVNPGEITG